MKVGVIACLLAVSSAYAGVYTRVDPVSGMQILTNVRGTGGQPAGTALRAAGVPQPAGFPRVSAQLQRERDATRRDILLDELAREERALSAAKAGRAAADVLQRHEANLSALRRELHGVRP